MPRTPAPPGADVQRLGAVLAPQAEQVCEVGVEPADPVELPAIQPGLVLQHAHERRPPGVADELPGGLMRSLPHGQRIVELDPGAAERLGQRLPMAGAGSRR